MGIDTGSLIRSISSSKILIVLGKLDENRAIFTLERWLPSLPYGLFKKLEKEISEAQIERLKKELADILTYEHTGSFGHIAI